MDTNIDQNIDQNTEQNTEQDKRYTYEDLLGIVDRLRGEGGCPWDRAQTHESLSNVSGRNARRWSRPLRTGMMRISVRSWET